MDANFYQFWLTCLGKTEADKIARVLLEKHLIVCAKQLAIGSDFLWEGKIDHNDEILLVMDSREDLFEEIEAEVTKLHSYDTFVLQVMPLTLVSAKASKWMQDNLKQ